MYNDTERERGLIVVDICATYLDLYVSLYVVSLVVCFLSVDGSRFQGMKSLLLYSGVLGILDRPPQPVSN